MTKRNRRKTISGTIVANKSSKTIAVLVERYKKHQLYGKKYKISKKYQVHVSDTKEKLNLGDVVKIVECRPISKTKKFRLVKVLKSKLNKEGK